MEPRLVRTARAMLGLSQKELADACYLSWTSLNAFERERATLSARSRHAMVSSLEDKGIVFLTSAQEGVGVRLRKQRAG